MLIQVWVGQVTNTIIIGSFNYWFTPISGEWHFAKESEQQQYSNAQTDFGTGGGIRNQAVHKYWTNEERVYWAAQICRMPRCSTENDGFTRIK